MIVAVDLLNIKLYNLFVKNLTNLNIGYEIDRADLQQMIDIIQAIDYIQTGHPSKKEVRKIINIYAQ